MKNAARKKLIFIAIAVLAVFAIIVLAFFIPLQESKYVHIGLSAGISQGASEYNESIKVHITFWNEGNLVAKNLTATVIFTDVTHNKVVMKNILIGGDLLPDKKSIKEFDSEYTAVKTVPKTDLNVTVQFDWIENGQSKNTSMLVYSSLN